MGRALLSLWHDRVVRGVPPPPLDGEDLMRALFLVPGPRLGQLLYEVRLAWEAGELADRAQALRYAASLLTPDGD